MENGEEVGGRSLGVRLHERGAESFDVGNEIRSQDLSQ